MNLETYGKLKQQKSNKIPQNGIQSGLQAELDIQSKLIKDRKFFLCVYVLMHDNSFVEYLAK